MILTALAIFLNFDRKFQTYVLDTFPQYGTGLTTLEDNDLVKKALDAFHNEPIDENMKGKPMFETQKSDLGPAQEFIPGGVWFNSEPLTIAASKGKVVLVDFWTYTCINCIRTLPYLRSWHEKYADKGLVIVGVHTPEFEFEKSAENVQQAIQDFEIKYPVMQDNDFATWNKYKNRYWPAKYLIDKDSRIRYTHFGEGEYDETEKIIQTLLQETGTEVNIQINNPTYQIQGRTPELYLGNARRVPNFITFAGKWNYTDEAALPTTGSTLELDFEAKEVFLVMRPGANNTINQLGKMKVYLDGALVAPAKSGIDVVNGEVTIDKNRLYKLIKFPSVGKHKLKLEFQSDSIELYAFTFG